MRTFRQKDFKGTPRPTPLPRKLGAQPPLWLLAASVAPALRALGPGTRSWGPERRTAGEPAASTPLPWPPPGRVSEPRKRPVAGPPQASQGRFLVSKLAWLLPVATSFRKLFCCLGDTFPHED